MNNFQDWLEDESAIRAIFVHVGVYDISTSTEKTLYLSTTGYATSTADVLYLPIIDSNLNLTESLNIKDSVGSLSFGDIELDNSSGDLDTWLDAGLYIWKNRSIRVYVGDPRYTATNLAAIPTTFELVFDGVVDDIDARDFTKVNIKVRDKLQRLNTPITENILGDYGTWAEGQNNQETIRPLVFGEVHNMAPLLVDPSKLEYMFFDGNGTSTGSSVGKSGLFSDYSALYTNVTTETTGDPYYNSIVFLFHMDGTNGSQVLTDSGPSNVVPSGVLGGAVLSTAQTKFGTTSLYLNGTSAYVTLPTTLATGSYTHIGATFTIEAWIRPDTITGLHEIISGYGVNPGGILLRQNGTGIDLFTSTNGGSSWNVQIVASSVLTVNTWTHVAATKNGTTLYLHINGNMVGSATLSSDIASGAGMRIGATGATAANFFSGYIDEVRFSNTSRYNNPSYSVQSAAYSNTSQSTGVSPLKLGTSDFTVEMWAKPSSTVSLSQSLLFDSRSNGTATDGFGIRMSTAGNLYVFTGVNTGGILTSSINLTLGSWSHIALVRQSNILTLYVNGQVGATGVTFSNDLTSPNYVVAGAIDVTNKMFEGNITNVRVTKSAVYTSTFTVPTSALTAIANTVLLLKFDNLLDTSGNSIPIQEVNDIGIVSDSPFYTAGSSGIGVCGAERLIEIRDNGVPIYNANITTGASVNLNAGTFKLNQALAGDCTIGVQGAKKSINLQTGDLQDTYSNNIANLVAIICTQYGKSVDRLTVDELNLPNLYAFSQSHQQVVGLLITDRTNQLVACQQLVDSVGAQLHINRLGKLQILKLGTYTSDPIMYVDETNIIQNSLSIKERLQPVASTKIGYCKNYTVQTNLLTAIPQAHKDAFATEWYFKTVVDESIKSLYKLDSDPVQKDTLLVSGVDAEAESTRLNNYFKVPRTIFSFKGTAKLLNLKLGQQVNLKHKRFALTNGKTGQVVSVSPNWQESYIDVEVII